MNLACLSGLISLPDTLNFVVNLPSLLPDVATCRQMFIILNSYRRLREMIIPLLWSSGNLLGDWCLTCTTTELVSTLDMLCQYLNRDLKNEVTPAFGMWGHTHFGSDFPTVDRQNPQDLCCVAFTDSFFFLVPADGLGFPLMWQNISSFADYLGAWWESFDHIGSQKTALARCKHQLRPTLAWKHWAAKIPRSYNMFTRVTMSVNPSTDSIKPHQTPSDHLFSISNPATALCMIKSIYKGFASCRCCHKSPVGPASATGCLTNVPQ